LSFSFVAAADIAYVVRDVGGVDPYLIQEIEDNSFTAEIIYEAEVSSTNFDDYRMIIVGDQKLNDPTDIPVEDYRTMIFNSYNYYEKSGDPQLGWSRDPGVKTSPTGLDVKDASSSLVEGLPEDFYAYTKYDPNLKTSYLKGQKLIGINIIVESGFGNAVLATVDPGIVYLNGVVAQEKSIYFGIIKPRYWTAESKQLFNNSINWLVIDEDRDEDGFFGEEDCNDNNASINPNGTEIAYDDIDQDCDGLDLLDVDGDGYCLEGKNIINSSLQCANELGSIGSDCDDGNITTNPSNPDIYYNCINDAPIVEDIEPMTVYEGEVVEIIVYADDPEDDSLNYQINDSRFDVNGNNFTWQTDYDDYGEYIFDIIVSDGSLINDFEVYVEVRNTNQPPICSAEIPPVIWDEDGLGMLNLSEYCYDNDDIYIAYAFHNSSEDTFITLDSLENGIAIFSSEQDWCGNDWITFKAGDGKSEVITNVIDLSVICMNDAPIFHTNIPDLTWNEDVNLTNNLSLKEYFSDVDSVLEYSVYGNSGIEVVVDDLGLVNFYPSKDWYGTELVRFEASDEEYTVSSNTLSLTVLDTGEPPTFGNMNCNLNLEEDEDDECYLNASDPEGSSISYEIIDEDNMFCQVVNANGSELEYGGDEDYYGNASCLVRAYDNESQSVDYFLEIEITSKNDPPEIISYNPANNPRILGNTVQVFSIVAEDVDSSLNISWYLDGNESGTGDSYSFNQNPGNYNVSVFVSDEEFSENHYWNVFVGDISQFTCEEVNGNICGEGYYCTQDFLNVHDTEICCPIGCSKVPPSFDDADPCNVLNDAIIIEINEPDSNDDIFLGDEVKVRMEFENDYTDDQDFEVEVHLYNLDEDESVETEYRDITIDENRNRVLSINFMIPDDLDLDDQYAFLVKAEDEICNQEYIDLDIKRKDDDLVISEFVLPETASCGDRIEAKTIVNNIGSKDQEQVYVKIKNKEMGISEQSARFDIEEYDEDDEEMQVFSIKLPNNISEGVYKVEAGVYFEDQRYVTYQDMHISCSQSSQIISDEKEDIILGNGDNPSKSKSSISNTKAIIIMANIVLAAIILSYLIYFVFKKSY